MTMLHLTSKCKECGLPRILQKQLHLAVWPTWIFSWKLDSPLLRMEQISESDIYHQQAACSGLYTSAACGFECSLAQAHLTLRSGVSTI